MSRQFVYVTYIRADPAKIWRALTDPEFQKRYWFGTTQDCAWTAGAPWRMTYADGRVTDAGEVIEIDPPRRLVFKWRNEFRPELKAEGYSRCVYELEPDGDITRLTVTHSIETGEGKFIEAVSGGWPRILSSLKSLLETGTPITASHGKASS